MSGKELPTLSDYELKIFFWVYDVLRWSKVPTMISDKKLANDYNMSLAAWELFVKKCCVLDLLKRDTNRIFNNGAWKSSRKLSLGDKAHTFWSSHQTLSERIDRAIDLLGAAKEKVGHNE